MKPITRRVALAASLMLTLAVMPLASTVAAPVASDYGSITGTVTSIADGLPVAGAHVFVHDTVGGEFVMAVVTAADGTYSTGPIAPSQYRLVPSEPGLAFSAGYRAALVEPGMSVTSVDFALKPSSTVTGIVTTATNVPVTNARVYVVKKSVLDQIYKQSANYGWKLARLDALYAQAFGAVSVTDFTQPNPGLAYTDDNGRFTIDGIEPGTYVVRTSAPGRGPVPDQTITVSLGANIDNLRFAAGATIEGNFTYSDGTPVADVPVTAVTSGLESAFPQLPRAISTVTDSSGHYAIVGLAKGSYALFAEGSTANDTGGEYIVINSLASTATIDLTTLGIDSIEGTVTDAFGSPLAGADVMATMTTSGDAVSTTTDAAGHYSFDGLVPDTYDISFTRNGYGAAAGDSVVVIPADPLIPTTHPSPVVSDVTLTRQPWIFGFVRNPGGVAYPNADVKSSLDVTYFIPLVSETDGSYVSILSPGPSTLTAEAFDYGASTPVVVNTSSGDVIQDLSLRPLATASVPEVPTGGAAGQIESVAVSAFVRGDGGNPITKLTAVAQPGGHWCVVTYGCTIKGLQDDTAYKVKIFATNTVGASAPLVLSVRTKPTDMPRDVLSHRGKRGAAVIVFKTPHSTGGLRDFTLRYLSQGKWKVYKHKAWTHSPITVSGLRAGTSYAATLQAVVRTGRSTRSGTFYFTTG